MLVNKYAGETDDANLQLSFVFLVLPCLLLGYLGQAAYLMENHADAGQAFFSSVPSECQ